MIINQSSKNVVFSLNTTSLSYDPATITGHSSLKMRAKRDSAIGRPLSNIFQKIHRGSKKRGGSDGTAYIDTVRSSKSRVAELPHVAARCRMLPYVAACCGVAACCRMLPHVAELRHHGGHRIEYSRFS